MKVTAEMRRQRQIYDETKAAVEAVAGPGTRALSRVTALEARVAKLEALIEELQKGRAGGSSRCPVCGGIGSHQWNCTLDR